MVMKMNKTEFITELSHRLSYSLDQCTIINAILENNFFISKKNKDKVIEELVQKLDIDYEKAKIVYNIAVSIIKEEIENKRRHPFKSKD